MGRCVKWQPHGSVLGQLPFLIFVNDLEVDIMSMIFKFADDTKIFRKVTDPAEGLQSTVTTGFKEAL